MAYIEPVTNHTDQDAITTSVMNRIEGNAKANHDDISAEVTNRGAAISSATSAEIAARNAAIGVESAARIAADAAEAGTRAAADASINGRLGAANFVSGGAGTYGASNIGTGTVVIGAGLYMFASYQNVLLQIFYGGWYGNAPVSGLVLSDGVNYRLVGTVSSSTFYYRKLA